MSTIYQTKWSMGQETDHGHGIFGITRKRRGVGVRGRYRRVARFVPSKKPPNTTLRWDEGETSYRRLFAREAKFASTSTREVSLERSRRGLRERSYALW